jgi:uncharacterized protein (DUF58 family)
VTARAFLFATVGIVGVAAGIGLGSPEVAAIGVPFLVLLAVGLAGRPKGRIRLSADETIRAIEGDRIELLIEVESAVRRAQLDLDLPPHLSGPDSVELSIDGSASEHVRLECMRWGVYELDDITLFTMGTAGVSYQRTRMDRPITVKVFPRDEEARRLLAPIETQLAYGDLVARQRGQGIEYADLRQMQDGDDLRHVNWRASARSQKIWVNDRHPERNSDVVLFVDTFHQARRGVEPTLDLAVRAIAGLAKRHLSRHDRVGLITFGEPVRWLSPGMGSRQRYRILDTLMAARQSRHLYWRGISAIPRQALPTKAMIVAVTPLLDDRIIAAVADLHGRGLDVAVVEVRAESFLDPPTKDTDVLARRIWELQRDTVRRRFARHGVPITVWDPEEPFERPLMEVEQFRRHVARARV